VNEDIIKDIIARLNSALKNKKKLSELDADFWLGIETETRRDWAGERPYIGKTGEAQRNLVTERNRNMLRDWRKGERRDYLARKYNLSRGRVTQILTMMLREERPPLPGQKVALPTNAPEI